MHPSGLEMYRDLKSMYLWIGLKEDVMESKKDSIWVIVDRFSKCAHFLAVHTM